jgi:hypothetical protein
MTDNINHPNHYCEGRAYEPIDVIEDWGLGYHLGNVLKYISRAGRKQDILEDLKKARWYISREIETLEAATVPFAATYEDILEDQILSALDGNDPYADVDDQPLDGWGDEDYLWDPSLGPVELSQAEIDSILSKKDLDKFEHDEIVSTVERRGMIIGFKKDGSSCLLNSKGNCE